MTGAAIGFSDCYGCKKPFSFDIDTVPSVDVDPDTMVPPDVDPDTRETLPEPRPVERVVKMPVCPECVSKVNAIRADRGLPPLWRVPSA